jgi:DNA polymerase III subunit epsilon
MPLNFTAIDFETANGSPASPCAVGLVKVRDGKLVDGLAMMFQPPYPHNWFHAGNINVHGIRPSDVEDAISWDQALGLLLKFTGDDIFGGSQCAFRHGGLESFRERD